MVIVLLTCTCTAYPTTTQMAQLSTILLATTYTFNVASTMPTATAAKLYYTKTQLITTTPTSTTTEAAVSISLSITASGTNTAGQTYSLVCSATVTGSTDQPTFTWLDPMNNPVPSVMVTTTGSMSTLKFSPLIVSHAGTYTCRVTTGGVTETHTTTVIVNGTIFFCL